MHSDKLAVALRMGGAARRIQVSSAKKSAVQDTISIGPNGQNLYLFVLLVYTYSKKYDMDVFCPEFLCQMSCVAGISTNCKLFIKI